MPRELSLDFSSLRDAYQSGAATPSSVVRRLFDEIASRGDDGIWISLRPIERVLADAATLESQSPTQRASLPLWGMVFAIKDNIDFDGLPTTAGCPDYAYQPDRSATVVAKLIAAGAVLIGKTALDQFATGLVGARVLGRPARNPFDPDYVSGGSSSGSAVATAVGLVSFALGTDTAGSGRVPAGLCNIVGLKPTPGRVSNGGVVPAMRSVDCVSILALTVEDAAEVLAVMEGEDPADGYSRAIPADHEGWSIGAAFRFGVPSEAVRRRHGDAEAEAGFRAAIDRFVEIGGTPVEIDYAPLAEAAAYLYGPLVAERLADLEIFIASGPKSLHPVTARILAGGKTVTAAEYARTQHRISFLASHARRLWTEIDCLVVPTVPRPVTFAELEIDPITPNSLLGTYTNFVNLLDLAALAVPAGFRPDGLPHGVTLIGPAFADAGLAALGARFQRATGGTLGATGVPLPMSEPVPIDDGLLPIVVFGAHLSGEFLNTQLVSLDGTFDRPCQTAPHYRLHALPDGRPGLVRVDQGGAAIAGEIWRLPPSGFGRFVSAIPKPLGIGRVELDDGSEVPGFLCEAYAVAGAPDITSFGGWRAWRASRKSA